MFTFIAKSQDLINEDSNLYFYLIDSDKTKINRLTDFDNLDNYLDSGLTLFQIKSNKQYISRLDKFDFVVDTLFSFKEYRLENTSLINYLHYSTLKRDSSFIKQDTLNIYVSGIVYGIGSGADPFIKRQFEKTIEYYKWVSS